MSISFSTKAGTLDALSNKLVTASILPLQYFKRNDFLVSPEGVIRTLTENLGDGPYIVRSSSMQEDQAFSSSAGQFLSILNVVESALKSAIAKVFSSYTGVDDLDEVLVQPMLQDVIRSGVAFSHDPKTCAPYRVINWVEGPETDAITNGSQTGEAWIQAGLSSNKPPIKIEPVIQLINELEVVFSGTPLDCEFAVTADMSGLETVWLLQVRPLVLEHEVELPEQQAERLTIIENTIKSGMQPKAFLGGHKTVYGVMPDWNPAEIIGLSPKPLALSLYRELITDSTWAYQRHNYGYRNLRSFPLMVNFYGKPYIDVRVSFNSFIPSCLDEALASKLVDYYIDRLVAKPHLHDKVEFEIVFSCNTLDLPRRLGHLEQYGFSKSECLSIQDSLQELTNKMIHPDKGLWKVDFNKLDTLRIKREKLYASNASVIEQIYWLIEHGKRYGTLPFAGLARAGFVAVQLLKSLKSVGIFSSTDEAAFMKSISTISTQSIRDHLYLNKDDFLRKYGHLRPGTYDILSPRYDEESDLYYSWGDEEKKTNKTPQFTLSAEQSSQIEKILVEQSIDIRPDSLLEFIRRGIELREYAKFCFTKNLSDCLSLIAKLGAEFGIKREDLAYCNFLTFKELSINCGDLQTVIRRSIENGKEHYQDTLKLTLPPLITKPEDVWGFSHPSVMPNFISQTQVTAPVIIAEQGLDVKGKIVCIPNADPGYDWLFAHSIAGLITAWGGGNSHMAIRSNELGIPAVIGAGEKKFNIWSKAKILHLDCIGEQVTIIS